MSFSHNTILNSNHYPPGSVNKLLIINIQGDNFRTPIIGLGSSAKIVVVNNKIICQPAGIDLRNPRAGAICCDQLTSKTDNVNVWFFVQVHGKGGAGVRLF